MRPVASLAAPANPGDHSCEITKRPCPLVDPFDGPEHVCVRHEINGFAVVSNTKPAGERLVAALTQPDDPYTLTVLIVECGRIATRLENLDALLSGEQTLWARLRGGRDGDLYLSVDNALSEARQQATVLRHLLGAIERKREGIPVNDDDDLAGLFGH
jgi:hypothetical protein